MRYRDINDYRGSFSNAALIGELLETIARLIKCAEPVHSGGAALMRLRERLALKTIRQQRAYLSQWISGDKLSALGSTEVDVFVGANKEERKLILAVSRELLIKRLRKKRR